MGHSRPGKDRQRRLVLYSIPLIAILGTGLVIYFAVYPTSPPAAVDYSFKISIKVFNSAGNASQYIVPGGVGRGVGVAGGIWKSHYYDGDGLNNNYPIYSDPPVSDPNQRSSNYPGYSIVHVKSRVARNYTLADFFAVWGEPLSPQNAVGIANEPGPNGRTWDMCTGYTVQTVRPGHWGSEVLVTNLEVTLLYSKIGCI